MSMTDSYLFRVSNDEAIVQSKGSLAVVADGVGSGPAGKLARSTAVELVREIFYFDSGKDDYNASLVIKNRRIRALLNGTVVAKK